MGARIGLQSVLDFPDRLNRAALGGLGAGGAVEDAARISRALRGGEPESASAESFKKFASARTINDLDALAACMEGLGRTSKLDADRLSRIQTPILLVVGERDDIADDAAVLADRIPTARLVVIPGRDHMGTVPARQFKDAVVEFLAEA